MPDRGESYSRDCFRRTGDDMSDAMRALPLAAAISVGLWALGLAFVAAWVG